MKFLIALFLLILVYVISYWGMKLGWGLEPHNMGWVVASYASIAFVSVLSRVLENI
jgi:hypothetical protein